MKTKKKRLSAKIAEKIVNDFLLGYIKRNLIWETRAYCKRIAASEAAFNAAVAEIPKEIHMLDHLDRHPLKINCLVGLSG